MRRTSIALLAVASVLGTAGPASAATLRPAGSSGIVIDGSETVSSRHPAPGGSVWGDPHRTVRASGKA